MKKNLQHTMLITVFFLLLFSCNSCSNEELFVEPEAEIVEKEESTEDSSEEQEEEEEVVTPEDETEIEVDTSLPCDFSLTNIQPNTTIIINCLLDLGGTTVNLPSGVTIEFEGGDIINGEIIFSSESVISGELLNKDLKLSGTTPSLKDPTFVFKPERWGIVEGKVNDDIALDNKDILQRTIDQVKLMGADEFSIETLDAYFKVDIEYYGRARHLDNASIYIPEDFHLKMSENAFLRVQPNKSFSYSLFKIFLADNVIISGGNLIGDRFEHDYSPIADRHGIPRDTHEYGNLVFVIGSENIVIDNVSFSDPTGDAIMFHGESLRQDDGSLAPGKKETKNVIVKNCTISRARRNGISFLDGRFITIDNCTIKDTGKGDQAYDSSGSKIYSSSGVEPRWGIDMEAIRHRTADGRLRQTALNENIIVRNSVFTGNHDGDVLVFTANDVLIENNFFDRSVGSFASHDVVVRNNTFESRETSKFTALSISSFVTFPNEEDTQGKELNHHWLFVDNYIKGYNHGISIKGEHHEIRNNRIENCVNGVFLVSNLLNTTFTGNTITSNINNSRGYRNIYNTNNSNNIVISNEIIEVKERPLYLNLLLNESNLNSSQITFKNCTLNSTSTNMANKISNSKNIRLEGNITNTDYIVENSENINLIDNLISTN